MEEVFQIRVRTKPALTRLYPSERRYSARTVMGLAVVHILLGATSVLLGAMDIVLNSCWVHQHGAGIWLGISALVAGLTGILASKRWYVDNNIRWFLISSVISGLVSIACITATAVFLAINQEMYIQRQLSLLRKPPQTFIGVPSSQHERQMSLFEKLSSRGMAATPTNNADVSSSSITTGGTMPSRTYDQTLERFKFNASNEKLYNTLPETATVTLDPIPSKHSTLDTTTLIESNIESLDVESTSNNGMILNSRSTAFSTVLPDQAITTVTADNKVHVTKHEDEYAVHNITSHKNNDYYLNPNKGIEMNVHEIRYSTEEEGNFNHTNSVNDGNMLHFINNIQSANINDNSNLTTNERIRRAVNIQSYSSENYGDPEVTNASSKVEDPDDGQSWHFGGNVRTVLCINIIVAAVLECLWSMLSVSMAWKGTRNRYPDENKQAKPKGAGDKPKKGKPRNKPDILRNHRERMGVSVIKLDADLPTAENTMDYQERVQRYLESNSDPSDNTGKKV